MSIRTISILLALSFAGSIIAAPTFPPETRPARAAISTNDLMRHIRVLSSDEFEGRAPGTAGEEKTVNYLSSEFKKLGLAPGNPDGTFIQRVPLIGFKAQSRISFAAPNGEDRTTVPFPSDGVIWSRRLNASSPEVTVTNSEVVFVGYGVVAPEYGWDDFKDVDVRGKTILMLINDPPIPDPADPSKLDDKVFKGRAMTYYGRWTYKYEIAAAKGAAAAIIVHETGPAGYPWAVVEGSNSGENFELKSSAAQRPVAAIEGWVTLELGRQLCQKGGQDFDALKRAALTREFRPVPLKRAANFSVKNSIREVSSRNVIAKVPGADPRLNDEYIIYTAHWDHLGRDPQLPGDQIYNGAADNASGLAALLELADAFTKVQPRRSILFLAVTAEETGLLGARYYATNPLYPLEKTVANINMDNMNMWGRTRDVGIVGAGQSTLEEVLRRVTEIQGRTLHPEPEPEKGYYFRSDHFEFARNGVPALYADEGIDFIDKPAGYGREKRAEYIARDYHKVSDEIKPGWDPTGLVLDVEMLFQAGYSVAQANDWPQWKEGSEFKARRDQMLRKARAQ